MGNAAGHGTSGTRYFADGADPNGAGTSVITLEVPYDCWAVALRWSADALGSGTGTLDVALCTVTLPSTVVATELAFNIDADAELTKQDTAADGAIVLAAGDRLALQMIVNGTISASQTRPRVWIHLKPR